MKKLELTDKDIEQIERLSGFCTIKQLSDIMGFSTKTFERVRNRDSRAKIAYEKGFALKVLNASSRLYKIAMKECRCNDHMKLANRKKDAKPVQCYCSGISKEGMTSLIFFLKTQAGWRETERKKVVEEEKKEPIKITVRYPEIERERKEAKERERKEAKEREKKEKKGEKRKKNIINNGV
jgi:hypothetical protein